MNRQVARNVKHYSDKLLPNLVKPMSCAQRVLLGLTDSDHTEPKRAPETTLRDLTSRLLVV